MRVIGGEAGGRRLIAPAGRDTRPTTDRIRESLFAIISGRLQDALVLDVFAGSGALSMEALSRGASRAVLIDKDPKAVLAIEKNIQALGYEGRARLVRADFQRAFSQISGTSFSLVFVDPPYAREDLYEKVLLELAAHRLLAADALIVLEKDIRARATIPPAFRVADERRYADTVLVFLTPEL